MLYSASPLPADLIDVPDLLDASTEAIDDPTEFWLADANASLWAEDLQTEIPGIEVGDSDVGVSKDPVGLIIVDQNVDDWALLVDEFTNSPQWSDQLALVVLESNRDGVTQITEALAQYQNVNAVHLISHGTAGELELGNSVLNLDTLEDRRSELQQWRSSLADGADFLIYGCDVAGTETGERFLESLQAICDCDVAASNDVTGHESLGGDWDFEFRIGEIEPNATFAATSDSAWVSSLMSGPTAANVSPDAGTQTNYTINEGDSVTFDATASSDTDGSIASYQWDLDNDGTADVISGSAVTTVDWNTLTSFGLDDGDVGGTDYTIGLTVVDDQGAAGDTTTVLTIFDTAPTLSASGDDSVQADVAYRLFLSATDPGNDTIASWTINWGDGKIEEFVGNPSEVSHTYTGLQEGFTFNILASALDEDGRHLQNSLIVADSDNDRLIKFDPNGQNPQAFGSGNGTDFPLETIIGPDGSLYVSGWDSNNVLRFDPETGDFLDEFVTDGSGGLESASGLAFGPDGNLYVGSRKTSEILRFNGTTGDFIDVFVDSGSGGLSEPQGIIFGPNGELFVADFADSAVLRFDGKTGDFIDQFVSSGSGGLDKPEDIVFGPDGHLYVAGFDSNAVLRFNGVNGNFIDQFGPANSVNRGEIWFSVDTDTTAQGETFRDSEIVTFGDSGDKFSNSGVTSGTFDRLSDFDAPGNVRGLHYVESDIRIGNSPNHFNLERGDLLISFSDTNTILNAGESEQFTATRQDIVVFRPDNLNDYDESEGEWFMLLNNGIPESGGQNIHAIALVEKNTVIGELTVPAGTLLVAHGSQISDIRTVAVNSTGDSPSVVTQTLVTGSSLGTNSQIQGLHLVQDPTLFGDVGVEAGTILVEVNFTNTLGGVSHNANDIIAIDVSQTAVAGPTIAKTSILFRGNDLGLSASIDGFTVVTTTQTSGTGTLSGATGIAFGPDGNLYSSSFNEDTIKVFDRVTGALVDNFVDAGSGGLSKPDYLTFLPSQQVAVVGKQISGTIYEDVDGDGDIADDGIGRDNVLVSLYIDDGSVAGEIDANDSLVESKVTDASGNYVFTNVSDATYWVVVDSTTVSPDAGFTSAFASGNVWAEQTFGAAGSVKNEGSFTYTTTAGAFFGGMRNGISDDVFSLTTAEHVTRVIVNGGPVNNIDSGFSFNTITTTADDGATTGRSIQGSLRQFILNANAISNVKHGANSSFFALAATDPNFNATGINDYQISLTDNELPTITERIVLDATTQAGFVDSPIVSIDGNALTDANGITIQGDLSVIRGFAIGNFDEAAVLIASGENNQIAGNYLGTDATGNTAAANRRGVVIESGNNTIGGTSLSDRNVISGNTGDGVFIRSTAGSGNQILGNIIGLNATGTVDLGNGSSGIEVRKSGNIIGGSDPGAGNIISGNAHSGIGLITDETVVQGNLIGTDINGNLGFGNDQNGIRLLTADKSLIGGKSPGEGNTIVSNGGFGVHIEDVFSTENAILGNEIHGNGARGIKLSFSANSGAVPVSITSAHAIDPSNLEVSGTYSNSLRDSQTLRIEFFKNTSDAEEGVTYLGFLEADTDASGDLTFSHQLATPFAAGEFVTATVTDASSNTSQFSNSLAVVANQQLTTNTGIRLDEGDAATITSAMLEVTNSSQPNSQIVYTITKSPDFGDIIRGSSRTRLGVNDTFTQAQIDNGIVFFVHDGSENFSDTFDFDVDDGSGAAISDSFQITIDPVNDQSPIADTDSFEVDEGGTATESDLNSGVSLLDGDTDDDMPNDSLVVSATPFLEPQHGTLTLNPDGTFVYVHDGSETTSDSFSYRITDEAGNVAAANVNITIRPDNDQGPTADNESFTIAEGATATESNLDSGVSLLDGDTDPDLPNDTLTISTNPIIDVQHGTLTLNPDGTFIYVHDGSETTSDSFVYEVTDAAGNTATANVSITIQPVNDHSPVADDDSIILDEGATATESDLMSGTSLLDGDTDTDLPNDTLLVNTTPVVDVRNGTLTLNPDGTFVYVHDGSETTLDSFVYEVTDEAGNATTANVNITIRPVNDHAPVADDESFTIDEGATATEANLDSGISLLDGDTDTDLPNDTLTVLATPRVHAQFGDLTLNPDGTFIYVHDGSENFTDSFSYVVVDASGSEDIGQVKITINPVNDRPDGNEDEYIIPGVANYESTESILANDSDAEGSELRFQVVVSPSHGELIINPDGTFTYRPNIGFVGTDEFQYQLNDGEDDSEPVAARLIVEAAEANAPVATTTPSGEPDVPDPVEEEAEESVEEETTQSVEGTAAVFAPPPAVGDSGAADEDIDDENQALIATVSNVLVGNSESQHSSETRTMTDARSVVMANSGRVTKFDSNPFRPRFVTVPVTEFSHHSLTAFNVVRGEMSQETGVTQLVTGTSMFATFSVSVGYAVWLIRGGVLLSSVMTSLPAWHMVDPLPVLGYLENGGEGEGESLEGIVRKSNQKHDQNNSIDESVK
ncbi:MAG: Ig-like domain-containing protein [Planctomycetota bacterium]